MELNTSTIMSILSPIVAALIIWYVEHRHMEADKKRDKREEDNQKECKELADIKTRETFLSFKLQHAIGKLAYANSVAIRDQKVNGVMTEAMDYFKVVNDEFGTFLQEQSAAHIVGR